jgi:hypothetical protein
VYRDDRLRDLLAVRADVLDRGRPGRAGNPGQTLHPGKPLRHGTGDKGVPRLTGRHPHQHRTGIPGDHPDPTGAQQHHLARETGVAHHDVAAACQDERRLPFRGGGTYGSHRFVRFGHDCQRACRAAEA